ncbi:pyridoxal phosphate-dependent aminotransferase [Oribacterium sp. WCC10]|uniref:pyridoxal phosphate-dependent aminotransferase n=1 Tax=Oribacterium sp. WCC10 TaxID=1855343 RepID=UPI0008ECD35F|nr:threonine-phosphate decarboxylase [Oribacterium sp. WCC10]SFG74410.1 L-threonine O-3-phosphate decarboxylase [Oribacterium sp. WCC10]
MNYNHGGDIYGNKVELDFSVNINPLGMPESAKEAAKRGVNLSIGYPDWDQRELRSSLSKYLDVSEKNLLFGNGAADIIYRLMQVLKPKKVLVPAPSFSEYRKAAALYGADVEEFFLREEDSFSFTHETKGALCKRIEGLSEGDVVFICNPNNPDGAVINKDFLRRIYDDCEKKKVWLVVDECFLPFFTNEKQYSMIGAVETGKVSGRDKSHMVMMTADGDREFVPHGMKTDSSMENHLIILRAFTKIFGMPGLRLGYMVTENHKLLQAVRETMTPWDINVPAQMAGAAALKEEGFIEETRRTVARERKYLVSEMQKNRLAEKIYNPDSEANFILFRVSEANSDLKERLLQRGILIRSCRDYIGLDESYFRICVRTHEENLKLINEWKYL